jgi:putative transposase
MHLNNKGEIALSQWLTLPEYFSHIELDDYIIMPNHMHGIICMDSPKQSANSSLGEIIKKFKGATTYSIRSMGVANFAWQRNYYEHIIRSEKDLARIRQYIADNPACWAEDKLYTPS